MGDYWWMIVLGLAMWAVMIGAMVFGRKNPNACPNCQHEAGLNDRRKHCPEVDHVSGWISDQCECQNDYHWNHSSVGL